MSVSKDDAQSALHDVEATERRSRTLFGYGLASPYLLLWGALWIVAGAADALSTANPGIVWGAVDIFGLLATAWLIVRHGRRCSEPGDRGRLLRYVGSAAALAAFIGLTLMIFAPISGGKVLMFFTLLGATVYAIVGCWVGLRYAAVGIALAGVAVGVFLLAPAYLGSIVPFVGGAALILGGVWMRRA